MIINQFAEIEKKVDILIDRYAAVVAENSRLKEEILSLENELGDRLAVEAKIAEEKLAIRNTIDRLLARLDQVSEDNPQE